MSDVNATGVQVPEVGGRWSGYGTSHVVARVDPQGAGGPRWLPACDVSTDEPANGLRMVTAALLVEFRPSEPDDRQCPNCPQAVTR